MAGDRPDVFMPLYIGDYLAGTSRLTTELHGAYMLLIMDYWMNGPLPDDDQILASIAKMSVDAWSNARSILKHYFSIEDGQWKHKRVEQELADAYAKKRAAKEKAEKAAAGRWKKQAKTESESSSNASGNASSTPQEQLEECPSPSPSPTKPSKEKVKKRKIPDDFLLTEPLRERALKYWSEKNRPDLDPDDEFQKFRANHRSKGTTMLDWDAAWQTWYSNAVKFNPPPRGQNHATSQFRPTSEIDKVNDAISRRAREREEALSGGGRTFDSAGNLVETP